MIIERKNGWTINKELSERFIYAPMNKLEFEWQILFTNALFQTATEGTVYKKWTLRKPDKCLVSCSGSFDRDRPESELYTIFELRCHFPIRAIRQLHNSWKSTWKIFRENPKKALILFCRVLPNVLQLSLHKWRIYQPDKKGDRYGTHLEFPRQIFFIQNIFLFYRFFPGK